MDAAMAMALMPTLTDPEVAVNARVEISGEEFKIANSATIFAHAGFVVEGDGIFTMEVGNTTLTVVLNVVNSEEN